MADDLPRAPSALCVGAVRLDLSVPQIMGVVNATPDSFSDGGECLDAGAAVVRARQMVSEGAAIIDVGGESTRPGAPPTPPRVELERVVPVVKLLVRELPRLLVSVDTRRADVARAAIDVGASIINDVSGLSDDPELAKVVALARVPIVLMHRRGPSSDMYGHAQYSDVASEVRTELGWAIGRALEAGIGQDRILVDPGLGFSKRALHSIEILARLDEIAALGFPVVVGPSRKSFIALVDRDAGPKERLGGTAAAVALAVAKGAHILRVHDVSVMRQAAHLAHAVSVARRKGSLSDGP